LVIAIEGDFQGVTCEGETLVVNLHGALISTAIGLRIGMNISVHVLLTDQRAKAHVVYVDPDRPRHCGISLDEPANIWGVELPPENWDGTPGAKSHQK